MHQWQTENFLKFQKTNTVYTVHTLQALTCANFVLNLAFWRFLAIDFEIKSREIRRRKDSKNVLRNKNGV